jgi:hypothetical protein
VHLSLPVCQLVPQRCTVLVRENLFTKKTEKEFFKQAADEAAAQDKMAVLLSGFDRQETNMLLDERAYKIKQANREHTIIVRDSRCAACTVSASLRELSRCLDVPLIDCALRSCANRLTFESLLPSVCEMHDRSACGCVADQPPPGWTSRVATSVPGGCLVCYRGPCCHSEGRHAVGSFNVVAGRLMY